MSEPQSIQPTGFHLRLSSDWRVSAVSANIGDFLPVVAELALGQPITTLFRDDAIHDVRNRMALLRSDDAIEHLLRVSVANNTRLLDLSIFRDGNGYGIDAEPSDGHAFGDPTAIVEGMLARVASASASDPVSIANEAARQLRALTGFDRVLVFGGGNLLGQSIRPGQNARDPVMSATPVAHLTIADRRAEPVAILTADRAGTSKSTLRVPSDEEGAVIDSLQARAACIVPLLRDGQPWGHIGCYHGAPRHLGVERRSVACLFARFIALQIEVAELRAG